MTSSNNTCQVDGCNNPTTTGLAICPKLRRRDWTVEPVALITAQELVRDQHYSGGGSNTATFRHGLFHIDDPMTPYGVAWWIPPTKSAAINSYPEGDWQRVLVLSRLVIDPAVPTNGASFLLGASERLIRADGRWECLVTYADTWQGHTGAIYRATNWDYVGLTKGDPVWVDTSGRMVARKAGPNTRTRAEMEALGFRSLGSHPKHKFRKVLVARTRKGRAPRLTWPSEVVRKSAVFSRDTLTSDGWDVNA